MQTLIHRSNPEFTIKKNATDEIINGSFLNVTRYKALRNKSFNVTVSANGNHDDELTTHFIYILKGEFRLTIGEEIVILHQNDNITITAPLSYNILSLVPGEFLFGTTSDMLNNVDFKKLDEMNAFVKKIDPYTFHHGERVGMYSEYLANSLIGDQDTSYIHYASTYHDVGKYYVPKTILNKPGKLTEEEYDLVMKHPIESSNLLLPVFGEEVARIARHHHERLDGSGYPDHLKGDEIKMDERIIAVADVFDALTSKRSYRDAYSFDKAIAVMKNEFNGKLDELVIAKLEDLIKKGVITPSVDQE